MTPLFELVGHSEDYFLSRGANKYEIGVTLATGSISSTYRDRYIATRVFTDGYERPRGFYPHKELQVVYSIGEQGIYVITVIVRFGFWRDEE